MNWGPTDGNMISADDHYERSAPESEPGDTCPSCGDGELFMLASRPALACDTCNYEEDWNHG